MALNFTFLHLRPPPSSVITYVLGISQVCASARGVLQLQNDNFVRDRTCQYRLTEYRYVEQIRLFVSGYISVQEL
jgi:hypothetical protein